MKIWNQLCWHWENSLAQKNHSFELRKLKHWTNLLVQQPEKRFHEMLGQRTSTVRNFTWTKKAIQFNLPKLNKSDCKFTIFFRQMALSGSKWGRKYSRSRISYLWQYWGISLSNGRIWFTFWKEMDKVQANFQYQKITGNWWRRSYKCWFIWDTFRLSMWIQWARGSRNWWPLWDETRRNNLQSIWKTHRLRPFVFSLHSMSLQSNLQFKVINVGSVTFGNPIFHEGLQN